MLRMLPPPPLPRACHWTACATRISCLCCWDGPPRPLQACCTLPPRPPLSCSHAARFVAFVAGSAEALLLFVTLLDERLLERDLFGRQIVWWARGSLPTGASVAWGAPLRTGVAVAAAAAEALALCCIIGVAAATMSLVRAVGYTRPATQRPLNLPFPPCHSSGGWPSSVWCWR